MNRTKMYVALCAVAVGKKIIAVGEPIPSDASAAKINAWLGNNSIEEVDAPNPSAEAQAAAIAEANERNELERRATELGIYEPYALNDEGLIAAIAEAEAKADVVVPTTKVTNTSTITEDGSGQALQDASSSEKLGDGIEGDVTATLTGVVTKDGRVVELNALSVAALKKLATGLEISGAAQMKKPSLVTAITAIEFAAPAEE